jgi:hypothetical protein
MAKGSITKPPAKKKKGKGRPYVRKPRPASLTFSVPEAGKKYYGLSRTGSYDAADRGEIPTVQIGRLLRVPIALMEKMMIERAAATAAEKAAAHDTA